MSNQGDRPAFAGTPLFRLIVLLTFVTVGCSGSTTDPEIPFPIPDLTGTWSVAIFAPGGVFGEGVSSGAAANATFTGSAELRLLQVDGQVGGDYEVEGEVVLIDQNSNATVLPTVVTAGLMLNCEIKWDIGEKCGATREWCLSGQLLAFGGSVMGAIRATVDQLHVESPTQFELDAFKFYVDGLVDSTTTFQFEGMGKASRVW